MALIVTYGRVGTQGTALSGSSVPLEFGSGARSEQLTIGGGTESQEVGANTVQGGESVVTVYATEDCWISIGSSPNAEEDASRRFLPASTLRQFLVAAGDKISVIGYA